jgi:hypothetical protein
LKGGHLEQSDAIHSGLAAERAPKASTLRKPFIACFCPGSVGTAFGYTMQISVASWFMATLKPSAVMVGLVQSAGTLPTLLFGLVAGSLAEPY